MKYVGIITLIIVSSLSQAESNACLTIDREFNFVPTTETSMKSFTDSFMENMDDCDLSISEKGFYYTKLLNTLQQSSAPEKLDIILQVSEQISQSVVLKDTTPLDLYKDKKWNSFQSFINFINENNDYFLKFKQVENKTRSDKNITIFEQEIAGYPVKGVSVLDSIDSSALVCYKSKEVSGILKPLKTWADEQIQSKVISSQYFQPYLLHSMGFITANFLNNSIENASTIHFPNHIHATQMNYAIQNIEYTSKTQGLIDNFLKPIYKWTLIRDIYREQMNTFCFIPQLEWFKLYLEQGYFQPLFDADENKSQALELIYNEIRGETDYILLEYDETTNTIYKSAITSQTYD